MAIAHFPAWSYEDHVPTAIAKYLRKQLELRGWDVNELVERTGLVRQTVSRHINGHVTPARSARKLYAHAFGISIDDFEDGWRASHVPQRVAPDQRRESIPVFDKVPAGNGDYDPVLLGLDEGLAERSIPRWLVGIDDPTAFGVVVHGDSMAPDYQDGDVVLCSPQAPHESGMIATFRLDNGDAGVKQVIELKDNRLELRSINTRHGSRVVRRDEVVRLARVVGRYQKLFN